MTKASQLLAFGSLPPGARFRRCNRDLTKLPALPELSRDVLAVDDKGVMYSLTPNDQVLLVAPFLYEVAPSWSGVRFEPAMG